MNNAQPGHLPAPPPPTWEEFISRLARHITLLRRSFADSKACQAEIVRWRKELDSLARGGPDRRREQAAHHDH